MLGEALPKTNRDFLRLLHNPSTSGFERQIDDGRVTV